MLEFVFNKAELKEMIDGSNDYQDEVVVRLKFSPGKDKVFPARVTARCQKSNDLTEDGREIGGCPRPPGCD